MSHLSLLILALSTAVAEAKAIPRWHVRPRAQTISLAENEDDDFDGDSTDPATISEADAAMTSPSRSNRTRPSSAASSTSSPLRSTSSPSRSTSSSDAEMTPFSASDSTSSSSSTHSPSKSAASQTTSLLDKEIGGLQAKYFVIVMVGLALLFILMAIAVTWRRRKSRKEARMANMTEEDEKGDQSLIFEAKKRKRAKEIELGLRDADDDEEDRDLSDEGIKGDLQSFASHEKERLGSPPQGIAYPAQTGAYLQTLAYQFPNPTAAPANQFGQQMPTFSPPLSTMPQPPRSVRFR